MKATDVNPQVFAAHRQHWASPEEKPDHLLRHQLTQEREHHMKPVAIRAPTRKCLPDPAGEAGAKVLAGNRTDRESHRDHGHEAGLINAQPDSKAGLLPPRRRQAQGVHDPQYTPMRPNSAPAGSPIRSMRPTAPAAACNRRGDPEVALEPARRRPPAPPRRPRRRRTTPARHRRRPGDARSPNQISTPCQRDVHQNGRRLDHHPGLKYLCAQGGGAGHIANCSAIAG